MPSEAGHTIATSLALSAATINPQLLFQRLLHEDGSQMTNASDKEAVKNADLADLDVEVSDQNIESEDDVEVSDQDVESVDILDVEVFHANLESEEDDGDIKLSVSGSI